MANPVKGETALTLADGQSVTLVMDFDALVEAEQAYGKPLAAMMADAQAGYVGALRALLFGAMRAHHPDKTLRDASAIFMHNQEGVAGALMRAVELGFPDQAKRGGTVGNGEAQRRAGKPSGASGAKPG